MKGSSEVFTNPPLSFILDEDEVKLWISEAPAARLDLLPPARLDPLPPVQSSQQQLTPEGYFIISEFKLT